MENRRSPHNINSWGPVWFLLSVLFFAGCSGNDDGTGNLCPAMRLTVSTI
ncbi:hypothetical protein [Dysgonomonas sp. 511]|nr:hypothetical protein [Dysgonomonas sp. 511]